MNAGFAMETSMPDPHLTPPARPEPLLSGMYTRQQLAVELGFTCDTLCRWEARQIGPPCTRIGRRVLYRRDAVEAWLLKLENARANRARRGVRR
jgi:hypothetical protein